GEFSGVDPGISRSGDGGAAALVIALGGVSSDPFSDRAGDLSAGGRTVEVRGAFSRSAEVGDDQIEAAPVVAGGNFRAGGGSVQYVLYAPLTVGVDRGSKAGSQGDPAR